ncbi:hypothetical protein Q7P37_000861 [Cladosporium fusiforme]
MAAALWSRRVAVVKRQVAIQAASNPVEAGSAPPAAQAVDAAAGTDTSLYLGIGIGVGGALLIACIVVVVQIARKRAEHKRALAELEQGHAAQVAQIQHVRGDVPRPLSFARTGRLIPIHGKGGWGALGSNEEVNQPDPANHPMRKRRSYISLPKRIKQQGIPLRRLKHLSAIIESPRSRSTHSPTPDTPALPELPPSKTRKRAATISPKVIEREASESKDDFTDPSSPKPNVLPSFAIRSPGRYGASFVEESPKAKRSHSISAMIRPTPDNDVFGPVGSNNVRPPMHARSISLGAHRAASQPPLGPVPPLPIIAPHNAQTTNVRSGFCLSRMSSSSLESANSSVLVTSPILRGPDDSIPSPSLEQMVARDGRASLKIVSHRQWQNPLIAGPRPIPDTSPTVPACAMGHRHRPSVRSNVARYSGESELSRQLSTTSFSSSLDNDRTNRLSIPRLGTADRISIRSVSSVNSFKSDSGVKKVNTPRKVSRCSTTVSENGSPAERPKTGVLRDISGNACTPSRQASNATQDSSRSSNGNPFQWDSAPLQKPSALKGSPNARKGHRRQNCVRISTLTPQILGPPPSRPTSPSIMHGIEEEPSDAGGENEMAMGGLPFVSNQSRLSRPPSATVFAPYLRISTLRASLTSTSPTLSTWTTFQEHGLPSQPSDSFLSASASPGTFGTRPASRQSGQSSNYSIPSFPSPSKTTVTAMQRDQPVPEFYFTRPSTDEPTFDFGWERGDCSPEREQDRPPPFNLDMLEESVVDPPSSPPLPVSKVDEYDPAWPFLDIPKRDGSQEYDPASPAFVEVAVATEPSHSSPLASTITFSDDTARYSRPTSYHDEYQPDSPPCSPKSMPQDFGAFSPVNLDDSHPGSSTPRVASSSPNERLTSANASTIMARLESHKRKVDFPGAPILPPPIDDNPVPFPLNTSRTRSVSTTASAHLQPQRPAPPPTPFSPASNSPESEQAIPTSLLPGPHHQNEQTSSPIQRNNPSPTPLGPRAKPAAPLNKQILALRRMNSEMQMQMATASPSRQSRRYIHGLAREPAPLLPWIGGSPNPSESSADLFDFDFDARDVEGGAEEGDGDGDGGYGFGASAAESAPTSALDHVDLSDIERRLEGALAGFDVPATVDEPIFEDREKKRSSPVSSCSTTPPPIPCKPDQFEAEAEADDGDSRSSSVWEDGEKFWQRTSLSTIPGSSPSDAEKLRAAALQTPTPVPVVFRGGERRGAPIAAGGRMRSPSVMATPGSLYDADGFLRT